jgi:hypothetical protein
MSYSAKPPPSFVVILKLPENHVPLLIVRARGIVQRMSKSHWFPSPTPPLAEVEVAIDDLSEAKARTLTRVVDSVSARNAKRAVLVALLQRLASYVQAIAKANPDHAAEIAEAADMYLKKTGGPRGRVFHAKPGRVSRQVDVFAPSAGPNAAYEFQYSLDGGLTWLGTPQPVTTKASVTIEGGTRYDPVASKPAANRYRPAPFPSVYEPNMHPNSAAIDR